MKVRFASANVVAGSGVEREIARQTFEVRDGRLYDPDLGFEWVNSARTVLQGWRSLDGPAYVLIPHLKGRPMYEGGGCEILIGMGDWETVRRGIDAA